jgi:hypothetical protein
MVSPVPTDAPFPQPPAYQTQLAPVDKVPEVMVSVELSPAQIIDGSDEADGVTEGCATLMVMLSQLVVSQVPSALT